MDDDAILKKFAELLNPARLREDEDQEPVDYELVRRFANSELDDDSADYVAWLVATYREWHAAFLTAMDQRHGLTAQASGVAQVPYPARAGSKPGQASVARLLEYLARSAEELLAELMRGMSSEVVTVRSSTALEPYLEELRELICVEWDWPNRRDDGELQDPVTRAEAVRNLIVDSGLDLPFSPDLIAAYLVKEGLDKLCG